mmetsp:Transcript_22770/g.58608  ORF Transcript_22770/g.58608 Transcript_22770/m.58608 type:complete len:219 (+) Transcript_22770:112-768(+)
MKFGKMLRSTVEARMPSWSDYMLNYKTLKQLLNELVRLADERMGAEPDEGDDPLARFTEQLDVEVEKINDFYMDRIEEGVIILHAMTQQVDGLVASSSADVTQIAAIQRALVSYHFNLLMLQNYVALNFTGVVKILKKLDKKFGTAHRKAYLESIVALPFYNCAALGQVVEDTEALFAKLDAAMAEASARLKVPCGQPASAAEAGKARHSAAPMAQSV